MCPIATRIVLEANLLNLGRSKCTFYKITMTKELTVKKSDIKAGFIWPDESPVVQASIARSTVFFFLFTKHL